MSVAESPRPSIERPTPTVEAAAGPDSLSGHTDHGTQSIIAAEGTTSPQATLGASPTVAAPAGIETARPASRSVAPIRGPLAGQEEDLPGGDSPGRAMPALAPNAAAHGLADPLLALAADVLDDLEKVRIANENRLRQLTRTEADEDGIERGFGLDESHPDVARLAALVAMLSQAERQATLNLARLMRKHPLGPWLAARRGIGEKQGARLLAAVGDPYWNDLHGRPRLVSELWSYCGYGDAQAQRRKRGVKDHWSATAKMRAHLVAESCMKQPSGTRYRDVYEAARARYADAVHPAECIRCGPSGKPAQPGSPLSDGHKHARALRAVAKEVLRDLWREAKRLHETYAGASE